METQIQKGWCVKNTSIYAQFKLVVITNICCQAAEIFFSKNVGQKVLVLFLLMNFLLVIMFQVCSCYPQQVIVPKAVDDETLVRAATFRQGGRFPVLSYFHKDNQVFNFI